MKGFLCRLTSYLSKHWAFCFVLLSLLGLLGFASPVSALEYSGTATASWVGFQDATNTVPNPNDNVCDGWHDSGAVQTCFVSYSAAKANIYGVTNISHHSGRLYISPSAYTSGSLDITGTVLVGVRVTSVNSSTYPIRDLPSNYSPLNGNAFSFGIDTNYGVYDADSVTITSFKSTSANHGDFANIVYQISFKAHYNHWADSGHYYFNWRLNGRATTNGGMGQMWAPYLIPTGNYNQFHFLPVSATYLFNIAENGQPPVDPSQYDKKFDELNQSLGDLKTQNNTIIGQNQQIIDGQQKQTEAIENQTKQDKEQYESEKKEESDRENQGNADAEQAQGIFNFNILNPFAPLFEMFNPSGCVSIPTLSDWLNTEDTQVCPWFPAKVRSVVTPVLSIASMMLLFGFVVGWLNGNDIDGTIKIK